jgi:hypothetical protein
MEKLILGKNVALYPVNMMGPDRPSDDLGEPEMLLQPGDRVQVEGTPASNSKGVSYTPVTVRGKGPFWVRTQYLGEIRALPMPMAMAAPPGFLDRLSWWQIVLGLLGAGIVGYGAYRMTTPRRRS